MVSLGFTLEEPDHNQDLRMCSVYVHDTVPLPLLTGILALLRCLIGESATTGDFELDLVPLIGRLSHRDENQVGCDNAHPSRPL